MATILVVDDQVYIRELLEAILLRDGYTVLTAEDGEEALRVLSSHQGEIDLLITDLNMPGMDGMRLARYMKASWPGIATVFTTGDIDRTNRPEDTVFIEKPFLLETVEDTIQDVLEAS
jgi:two-component system cell cycle sensor histidine kinase/response regulator CckA